MKCALIFTLLVAAASRSLAAPFNLNDMFWGLSAEQQPEQDVVKRQVLANPDGQLKQISFNSLIGGLEDSLFQSALSLHGASGPDTHVAEVRPDETENTEGNDHGIVKRSDEHVTATDKPADDAQERKILLQTTKKVPISEEGVPAHLIIDHVSVQPHNGGLGPLIPTFQVHHTKITSATIKEDVNNDSSDGKQTKISITKTSITSTAPVESLETQSTNTNPESVGTSTTELVTGTTPKPGSITNTTPSLENSTNTTPKVKSNTYSPPSSTTTETILKLKQEEEKLKEKVAEVEAEPVILTSRV